MRMVPTCTVMNFAETKPGHLVRCRDGVAGIVGLFGPGAARQKVIACFPNERHGIQSVSHWPGPEPDEHVMCFGQDLAVSFDPLTSRIVSLAGSTVRHPGALVIGPQGAAIAVSIPGRPPVLGCGEIAIEDAEQTSSIGASRDRFAVLDWQLLWIGPLEARPPLFTFTALSEPP